jgi:hypothetical protein
MDINKTSSKNIPQAVIKVVNEMLDVVIMREVGSTNFIERHEKSLFKLFTQESQNKTGEESVPTFVVQQPDMCVPAGLLGRLDEVKRLETSTIVEERRRAWKAPKRKSTPLKYICMTPFQKRHIRLKEETVNLDKCEQNANYISAFKGAPILEESIVPKQGVTRLTKEEAFLRQIPEWRQILLRCQEKYNNADASTPIDAQPLEIGFPSHVFLEKNHSAPAAIAVLPIKLPSTVPITKFESPLKIMEALIERRKFDLTKLQRASSVPISSDEVKSFPLPESSCTTRGPGSHACSLASLPRIMSQRPRTPANLSTQRAERAHVLRAKGAHGLTRDSASSLQRPHCHSVGKRRPNTVSSALPIHYIGSPSAHQPKISKPLWRSSKPRASFSIRSLNSHGKHTSYGSRKLPCG